MKAIKSVTEQPRISLKNSFDALSNDADNNKTARSETDLREFVFQRGKQGDHRQERLAASAAPSSDHVAPSLTSASDVPGERRVRGRRFLRGLAASAAPQCLPVDTLQNLEACPQLPRSCAACTASRRTTWPQVAASVMTAYARRRSATC